ncbi:hypothetical protein [Nisaea sp.]|uniref:hypothetical protein n=1 Tax=Nisaea sp. TaxID=2024842 RepID=UPI003299FC18
MEQGQTDLPIIVYVDENQDALEDFGIDAKKSGLFSQVVLLRPERYLEGMITVLLELKFEALVSDFRLADAAPVDYNGAQLVERFEQVRHDFPCFIRTSYEHEALHEADDVNTVYAKENKLSQDIRPLLERVSLQVAHHRKQVEAWTMELSELLEMDRSGLSASTIDRILTLDAWLESELSSGDALPGTSKRAVLEKHVFEGRQALIDETERLVADIRKTLDE